MPLFRRYWLMCVLIGPLALMIDLVYLFQQKLFTPNMSDQVKVRVALIIPATRCRLRLCSAHLPVARRRSNYKRRGGLHLTSSQRCSRLHKQSLRANQAPHRG